MIAGAVLQLKYTGLLDILGDERLATPILLLAAGTLCSLLGFLGCCGAIWENYCLTVSFAVLLTLLLTIETAIAIAAYALQEPLQVSTFLISLLIPKVISAILSDIISHLRSQKETWIS